MKLSETQLIDRLLSARTLAAYKTLDQYLKDNPKQKTFAVFQALEAYEMYRRYAT